MATDATGAPTPLGIPKYNTSADAPSGLGFNAAMDVLDTLIAAKVGKPSGIASGEVPVWNGSTWVRSSATNIGPTSLGSGTPDATKFLRGDGSWVGVTSKIVQVVFADYSTQTSNATTSWADTGLSATITPTSSSNKVLVLVVQAGIYFSGGSGGTDGGIYQLLRGASALKALGNGGGAGVGYVLGTGIDRNGQAPVFGAHMDSPASTSALTYKTQFSKRGTGLGDTAWVQFGSTPSSMILMEVA